MKWYWTSVESFRWCEEVSSRLIMPPYQLLLFFIDHPLIVSFISLEAYILLIPLSCESELRDAGHVVGLSSVLLSGWFIFQWDRLIGEVNIALPWDCVELLLGLGDVINPFAQSELFLFAGKSKMFGSSLDDVAL